MAMNEKEETAYMQGGRAAWTSMLHECIKHLGYDGEDVNKTAWVVEREAAIAALRGLCRDHGDNDWDEDLHLADIIDKHLRKHLP
jgi:hypothetical protein